MILTNNFWHHVTKTVLNLLPCDQRYSRGKGASMHDTFYFFHCPFITFMLFCYVQSHHYWIMRHAISQNIFKGGYNHFTLTEKIAWDIIILSQNIRVCIWYKYAPSIHARHESKHIAQCPQRVEPKLIYPYSWMNECGILDVTFATVQCAQTLTYSHLFLPVLFAAMPNKDCNATANWLWFFYKNTSINYEKTCIYC